MSKVELTEDQEKAITDIFYSYVEETKNKNIKKGLWRIKLDGSFLVTRTNKTAWKSLEYAKMALEFHFKVSAWHITSYCKNNGIDYDAAHEQFLRVYHAFLNSKRIEFIETF